MTTRVAITVNCSRCDTPLAAIDLRTQRNMVYPRNEVRNVVTHNGQVYCQICAQHVGKITQNDEVTFPGRNITVEMEVVTEQKNIKQKI